MLALGLTLWALQFSRRSGRLSFPPVCDDVCYFNDGLDRLEALRQGGPWGLARSLWQNPPHAPFSTLLACFSFGLFGVHDWAPYLASGLIVFALLTVTDRLLWGARPWLRWAGIALVCALPVTEEAVIEFRPDFAASLLVVAGVLLLLGGSLSGTRRREQVLAGVIFGLALLAKPAMGLFTLAMLASTLGLSVISDWLLVRPPARKLLARVALVSFIAVALGVPYFVASWRDVIAYVHDNVFGRDKDIWAYQGSAAEQLGYYLWGTGARWMLGPYLPLLAVMLLAGLAYVLTTGRRELQLRAASYAGVTLIAWTLMNVISVRSPFFGLPLFFLVVCGAVISMKLVCAGEWPRGALWRWAFVVLLACLGLRAFVGRQQHAVWNPAGADYRQAASQAYADILATLDRHRREEHPVVFLTMQSPLHTDTLRWLERERTGGCRFQFTQPGFSRNLESFHQGMERSAFILAYETANPEPTYPWARLAPETLAMARSLEGFVEIGTFPAPQGVVYHLFAKMTPDSRDESR
jgi:hypothetical protein